MSILKYVNRVVQMDSLIKRRATGSPAQFADKLGISRSTLMEHLKELKILGGNIDYDRDQQTYHYVKDCCLEIKFRQNVLTPAHTEQIKGSGIFQNYFPQSRMAGLTSYSLATSMALMCTRRLR